MTTVINNQNKLERYCENNYESFVVDCQNNFKTMNANEIYQNNRLFDDLDSCINTSYYAESTKESYSLCKALAREPPSKKLRTSKESVPILWTNLYLREGQTKTKNDQDIAGYRRLGHNCECQICVQAK